MIERNSWERIRRQIKRLEETARNTDRNTLPRKFVQTPDHIICKANGNISALSGDAPGSGSAIAFDGSTTGSTLVTRGSSVTITNLGGQIVSGTYFLANRTPGTDPVWVADTAQAPPSPSNTSNPASPVSTFHVSTYGTPRTISGTTSTVLELVVEPVNNGTAFTLSSDVVTYSSIGVTRDLEFRVDIEAVTATSGQHDLSIELQALSPTSGSSWAAVENGLITSRLQSKVWLRNFGRTISLNDIPASTKFRVTGYKASLGDTNEDVSCTLTIRPCGGG